MSCSAGNHVVKCQKRLTVAKKESKPRRLRFKTANDRKKFLRSVKGLEGVSLKDGSEDENVVGQSLKLLQVAPAAKGSEDDTDNTLVDLHVFVLQPISLNDTNVIIEEDELLSANQSLDPFSSNVQSTSTAASNRHLERELS